MNDEVLRKVQLIQLEIALELKRICDVLDINYFLDSGTLLGAIRHKGFIPWDDDLDIGMKRDDYDLFIAEAPKILKNEYFLQTWKSDKNYGLAFSKIRKVGTQYIEEAAQFTSAHNGIYIDLFPYDVYPEEKMKQRWQKRRYFTYRRLLMIKCRYEPWRMSQGGRNVKFIKFFFYKVLSIGCFFINKNTLINRYNHFCRKYNNEESCFLYAQAGASDYGKWVVPRHCLASYIEVLFEGHLFKVPTDYDKYLTSLYGDYMELPPESQRLNRHKIIKVSFG